jgi:hypothetical protein
MNIVKGYGHFIKVQSQLYTKDFLSLSQDDRKKTSGVADSRNKGALN